MSGTATKWHECDCGTAHQAPPAVAAFIAALGRDVKVTAGTSGTWLVPRIYIAAHGIKAAEVPALAERYGWKAVSGD